MPSRPATGITCMAVTTGAEEPDEFDSVDVLDVLDALDMMRALYFDRMIGTHRNWYRYQFRLRQMVAVPFLAVNRFTAMLSNDKQGKEKERKGKERDGRKPAAALRRSAAR